MKRAHAILAILLASLAAFSHGAGLREDWCRHDPSSLVPLDTLAKEQGSNGTLARSALKYLAEKKHTTSGYFISKRPTVRAGNRVVYPLYHESGFKKPCVVGNQSGFDGVLEVDPSTNEVKSFLFSQ